MNRHLVNGEPVKLKKGELYEAVCCDCNLVHTMFVDKDCVMTSYRNDYETKKLRRKKKIKE